MKFTGKIYRNSKQIYKKKYYPNGKIKYLIKQNGASIYYDSNGQIRINLSTRIGNNKQCRLIKFNENGKLLSRKWSTCYYKYKERNYE